MLVDSLTHCAVLSASESTAVEKTKRAKVKEAFLVGFDESVDLDWSLKVTKSATTVTKVTLEKHSKQQTTLPEDLHYDASQLLKLWSMSSVMASRLMYTLCLRKQCTISETVYLETVRIDF